MRSHLPVRQLQNPILSRNIVFLGLFVSAVELVAATPDLSDFTPGLQIINYSVYATDSVYLPSNSGLASGGLFGSGNNMVLQDGIFLRAPKITVGGNFTLGANSAPAFNIPKVVVGGNFSFGHNSRFLDSVQVGGNVTSDKNNATFTKTTVVRGNLSLTGNQDSVYGPLRVGGTFTGNLLYGTAATVSMAAASGGPTGLGTRLQYNQTISNVLANPTVVTGSSLPGYGASLPWYAEPTGVVNINAGIADTVTNTRVQFLSGNLATPATTTAYYWPCAAKAAGVGLPASACHGDTLLPGYYGNLDVSGTGRAILLTEGFYSFHTITIDGGNGIVAAQPNGGRTVVLATNGVSAASSNAFIGPDGARMANGFGTGANQFLGGTMIVASWGDVEIPSDLRIWATLSAPLNTVHLASQVYLFGQIFAKRVIGANMIDFGQGAFIPFRGAMPAFTTKAFQIPEKADPACSDPSGRPCRDTVLSIVIAYTTAYDATADWRLAESSPRSATLGVDFKDTTGTINIMRGDSTATIKIRIFDDSSYEGSETFVVRFSNIKGAGCPDINGIADSTIHECDTKGTIIDDDLAPLVRIFGDTALPEGDAGNHLAPFTVRLYDPVHPANPLAAQNAPQLPVRFWWRTTDATALLSDNDYVAQAGKWDTIPASALTKSIGVAVNGDLRYENDEFFRARVDSARNGTVSGSVSDSGWILNDDAVPSVTVLAASVQEPAKYGDTAWAKITLQISAPSGLPTTVWYQTHDSSAQGTNDFATDPLDYLFTSSSVVIAADSLTQTIFVPVFGDTLFEKSELFKLDIDSLRNAVAGSPFGLVTIIDADSAPAVFVDDAILREPISGTTALRLPVRLSRPSGLPSRFVWSTLDSTALKGLDYRAVISDTMRIPAFVRDTFLEVRILSDSVAGEGDEFFKVALSDLVDLDPGDLNGVGTIQDAQEGFHLVIDSVGPVAEADSMLHFVAHTDWIAAFPIRLDYRTTAGTAIPGWRYADTSATGTIPAGSRSVALAVRMKTDSLWEPPEYFKLRLDSIVGANAPVTTDSVARGWIREAAELEFSFDSRDTSVREDSAGTVPVRIRLSQPASISVKIRLPLLGSSTATWIADFSFSGLSGDTLAIPAGNRLWSFGVPVVPDIIQEPDEIASLGIAPITTGIPGARPVWNLTILDDDHALDVEIQTPPDRLHTNKPDWTITWTIDGKPQPPKDTTFRSQGWNCVERSAMDRFGRVFADTNCIWLDTIPPSVQVFKITGPNPRDRTIDTTWWGDRAKTRYGNDTIWYWVRDSILDSDGKAWHVRVDTFSTITHFSVDGVHPTQVSYCDSVGNCAVDTGWIELKLGLPNAMSGVYLDRNRDGRIDAMIVELSEAWKAFFLPTFDAPLPPEIRKYLVADSVKPFVVDSSGGIDETRFLVTIDPPFRFGATSFDSLYGVLWESWTSGTPRADSFLIRDSVPPVIVKAVVLRVENYKDPDTVLVTPSEAVTIRGDDLFEVGTCPSGMATCPDSQLVWVKVPQESVKHQSDGTYKILVSPGDSGSVRPGLKIRFLEGVSDLFGNQVDTAKKNWATLVVGDPRPDLVQVSVDRYLAEITAEERDKDRQPGILIRATRGSVSGTSVSRQWWEPGRGYIGDDDPAVRAVCPEIRFCNGPTLYINRPARMLIYIYDNGGTFVMNRTVDITQADIDRMNPDQIDRLAIDLEWNHRTSQGKTVSSGVYLWRIVSYVKIDPRSSPVVNTKLFKLGVRIPIKGGIF